MATQSQTATVMPSAAKLAVNGNKLVGASLLQIALYRLRRDRLALIALAVLLTLALLSLFAPVISQYLLGVDPTSTDGFNHMLPIASPGHILGTDNLGRDQLSRLLFAGQVSLGIAIVGAILSIGIGLFLGVLTGYYGGVLDDIITWLIATLNSIPGLFLLLIVSAVLRPGPEALVIVLGLLGWTFTTRLVRGETLSLRERDFILSAKSVGAPDRYIMFAYVVPNVISVTVVNLAITIGDLILLESALSFLGVGIQQPTPTWGNMLNNAQSFFKTGGHLVIFPGLLIVITVLCLYVIGDGLRDAFDPTLTTHQSN
jgi:peptide/nickel transport system permease protein